MKKVLSFLLAAVMACALFACACEGEPSDYTFESLESALSAANSLKEAELLTENEATVHYEQSSLKKYDVDSSQRSETAFRRNEDGKILELSGDYTLKTKEENTFSVYYKDGYAYYNENGKLRKEAVDASLIDDQSLFLSFAKDDVQNYSAKEKKGVITVTFTVPWESTSKKVVELYAQLASVMQSTGLEILDVTYKDISAEYTVDKNTGALKGYTYSYSASMKVDGKKVEVKGKASCTLLKTENVEIASPDLSLYE